MPSIVIGCLLGLLLGAAITSAAFVYSQKRDGVVVGEKIEAGLKQLERNIDKKTARANMVLKELEELKRELCEAGALDPYKSMDISMYLDGKGPQSLAGKWVRYAKEAREKYSRATGQLNYMLEKVSKDLGPVEGDGDRFPEIEGVAVLIVADLIMRETRKKMEGKNLVSEFEEKYGGDIFTNNLNWM